MARKVITANNLSYQYEPNIFHIFVRVVVGASGAVDAAYGGGVLSVVKESTAGQYTITLQDRFQRLLNVTAVNVDNAVSAWASCSVLEDGAVVNSEFAADGAFKIQLQDYAGLAVNATNSAELRLMITVGQGPSPYDTNDIG